MTDHIRDRIVTLRQLTILGKQWRRNKQRVVFTNGVFDLLHRGHLMLLTKAKAAGDVLVVGLNTDVSVRRLKGPDRPINNQRDRAMLLAALRPVDVVCLFGADTPLRLINSLRPNVLVKGSEYSVNLIVGSAEVKSWGGTILRVHMKAGYSTTNLIRSNKQ